jgi:transitional endoplasmic reticulum ATPase
MSPVTARSVGRRALRGKRGQKSKQDELAQTSLERFKDVVFSEDEKVTLNDIGGLESVKKELKDIALSFKHPEIMAKWGAKRPQGVLMYGEPGTGKTMLVEALASEIEAKLLRIQSSDIYIKWLGESESKIKELFTAFRKLDEPTVVLFDEFDAIVGITDDPSPGGADNARNSVAGIFKQEMNNLAKENPNVLIVATTNHQDRIDPSLVRSGRFDHRLYIPMPDDQGREQIITGIIAKLIMTQESEDFKVFADDIDAQSLVRMTDGMSGADIAEIFRRIGLAKAMKEARSGSAGSITQAELSEVIEDFRTETV